MVVGRLLSYWEGNFSGAMLNFGRVVVGFKSIKKNISQMGSSAEGFFGEHQGFEITTSLGTMPLKWQWFFHMAWGKKKQSRNNIGKPRGNL